jgi:ketosteroid isomerase-like protein
MTGLSVAAATAVLEGIQAAWNQAMLTWDAPAVAALYDESAQLFGSFPMLFLGVEGVTSYYSAFTTAESCEATFDNKDIASPADNVIVASGFVTFAMRVAGEARCAEFRFTFVLHVTDRWRILAHHASPIPTTSPAD